jgi:lipopolysaccharide export system permease protein
MADERSSSDRVVHTARKAFLVPGDAAPKLVMVDGSTQSLSRADRRMSVTRFSDFTLELAGLVSSGLGTGVSQDTLPTAVLIAASEATQAATGATEAQLREEGHSRLAGPLLAVAAPLLGFAALMLGSFSRFGLWRQMAVAVGLLIAVQMVWTWSGSMALQSAAAWPLVYLGPLLGIAVAAVLLAWAQRPRRLRGAVA